MLRIRTMLAVLASLAALAGSATAAPPAEKPAAPSAAPTAAAQELARALFPKEAWEGAVQQLSGMVQRNLEGHPGRKLEYPKDFTATIRKEVEAVLPYEELVRTHAKELSANFTDPELKDVTAFFGSPTGKKWIQNQQKVTEAVNLETQRRLEQKMPEVMQRLSKLAKAPEGSKGGAQPKMPEGHPPMGGGHPPMGGAQPKADGAPAKKAPAKKPEAAKKPEPAKTPEAAK